MFRRWAVADETHDEGVRGITAPVLGTDGHASASIMIEGPTARIPDDRIPTLGETALDAARILRDLPISLASTANGMQGGASATM